MRQLTALDQQFLALEDARHYGPARRLAQRVSVQLREGGRPNPARAAA